MNPGQRSALVNWGLLGVALALVVAVVATTQSVTSGEIEQRKQHLLAALRPQEIVALRMESSDPWRVLRNTEEQAANGPWTLTEPVQGEAEESTVDRLIKTLQFATWLRQVDVPDAQRGRFGLESPDFVLHIEMGDIHYRLRNGAPAPAPAGAHYLEVTGENVPSKGVFVVAGSVVKDLALSSKSLRVRRLIPLPEAAISGMRIEAGGVATELVQRARNDWRFQGQYQGARLARDAVDRLFLQISRTQAEDFLGLEQARGIQQGRELTRVTLTPVDKSSVLRLTVGGRCPAAERRVVAIRQEPEPLAACIPADVLVVLTERPLVMLDRHLFQLREDEIESLEVVRGDDKLALARSGNGFHMYAPKEADVEGELVSSRLQAMLGLQGEWVEADVRQQVLKRSVVRRASLRSVAVHEDQAMTETVELFEADAKGFVYARRQADGAVLRLAPGALQPFEVDASLLRNRQILELTPADLLRVTVDAPAMHQVIDQAQRGVFKLLEPAGYEADASSCGTLFDLLGQLEAESWVSDSVAGAYGLEQAELKVQLHSKTRDFRLLVGETTSRGGHFASVDSDGVFVLSNRVHRMLTTWAISRETFLLVPESTLSVAVETPDGHRIFERLGTEFVQTEGASMDASRVHELMDGLSVLRPEAAISLGPSTARHGLDKPLLRVAIKESVGLDGEIRNRAWRVGAGDSYRDLSIHFAEIEGQGAVYALPRASVQRLLDLL